MASGDWIGLLSDQASIDANRYGQMTPWQRGYLKPPSLVGSLIALAVVGAVVVPLDLSILVNIGGELLRSDTTLIERLILLVLLLFLLAAASAFLLVPVRDLLRKLRLRRDLTEGYIVQEDGQIAFSARGGYVARASGRTLRGIDGGKVVRLTPGMYRFYYLPRSRRVLSAERQMLFESGGPQAGLLLALSQTNNFSLDELDTNRQGRASNRQRVRLVGRLVVLLVVMGLIVVGSIWQLDSLLHTAPWSFLVLGGFLVLFLVMTYQRWLDLLEGRVALLEGYVEAVEDSDGEGVTYHYVLGRQRFMVSGTAYKALAAGVRYRLYYLPHSKRLVSIEPLP